MTIIVYNFAMRTRIFVLLVGLFSGGASLFAQTTSEPFKFGTFELDGEQFVGIVLRDAYVVHLEKANLDFERSPLEVTLPMARDMKELAGRYDLDLSRRIHRIVNALLSEDRLSGPNRRSYVYLLDAVKTLAPILYPNKILGASGNYYQHVDEMEEFGFEDPKAGRVPYLFMKPPTTTVIGDGDPILLPEGRTQIDWECELAIVIGQPAKNIPVEEAESHIFGYTIMMDVSDRGDENSEGGELHRTQYGIDWLLGKSHDTHAPLGPFILPKEFVEDPHELGLKLTVNGEIMQDSKGKYPSKEVFTANELLTHAASIMTLEPGDVISCGSPAGVGAGRDPQIFLKKGDVVVSTIEQIGSLTNPVK